MSPLSNPLRVSVVELGSAAPGKAAIWPEYPAAQDGGGLASDWAERLRIEQPDKSAGQPMWLWQKVTLAGAAVLLATAIVLDADAASRVVLGLASPIFACVILLRAAALVNAIADRRGDNAVKPSEEEVEATNPRDTHASLLPFYTVLVPLFRETPAVPGLVEALDALDWPRDRIEILFLTEACDDDTRRALIDAIDPGVMRVLTVPEGQPRTKPRALTYGLMHSRGELLVVYDAEDLPEPDQLKRAFVSLSAPDRQVGCVQARLNVYNAGQSWFSRQFAIEYTSLFDAMLPAFQRLGLALPLGGTSNHFRTEALRDVGGWDPYNVTEDADLGFRLARSGWHVEVLDSTTWEEAPENLSVWFGQRVRWLKGWMQTYLVHMRRPVVLYRELGAWAFFGFNLLLGGLILSAFIHPWVYLIAAIWLVAPSGGVALSFPQDWSGILWWFGAGNLLAAYITGMWLGWITMCRRGRRALAWNVVMIPFYWLLISLAAYRAAAQLVTAPYWWEKTPHRGAQAMRGSCG